MAIWAVVRLSRPCASPVKCSVRSAAQRTGRFSRSAATAHRLLAAPSADETVLHGDIHHGNVLHFGDRGWLAIDPKGLRGDRAFDYANLFCNPAHDIAVDPMRFERRVAIVAEAAQLDRRRLLEWVLAGAGLSALWLMEDEQPPDTRLQVAALAADALDV